MKAGQSLQKRLLVGALLWTTGLLAVTNIAWTALLMHFPQLPRMAHGMLLHGVFLSLLALGCMIVGLAHVRGGVAPLNELRARLQAVHEGRASRVTGEYPNEVQPLVDDVNALLDHREQLVQKALAKAGDLAHGLKTPLAVLAQEAERAAAVGQHDIAESLTTHVDRMRRQIDYHLAHARAAASGATPGSRASVAESAEGIVRTLRRLHAERGLTIAVGVPTTHAFLGERADLDEMLGNLIDNACKWARSSVSLTSVLHAGRVTITVDDDGPGLEASLHAAVLKRGVRADEGSSGSGLGLAIVADLADLYGGAVTLDAAPAGGLRARLQLPAAERAPEPTRHR